MEWIGLRILKPCLNIFAGGYKETQKRAQSTQSAYEMEIESETPGYEG
jgi:hypothetical protein